LLIDLVCLTVMRADQHQPMIDASSVDVALADGR
jgi:hypothetical protein